MIFEAEFRVEVTREKATDNTLSASRHSTFLIANVASNFPYIFSRFRTFVVGDIRFRPVTLQLFMFY